MSNDEFSKEERILRIMRKVLTDVAKDTFTKPGIKHPLTENTIMGIRDCLALITAREQELISESGGKSEQRPRFIDEPQTSVVVPFQAKGTDKKPTDESE